MPIQAGPTLLDIERIALLSDPVMRNLQITQCYHELARVLAERTGGYANWCTFATWASKQAGQTIRKEDLIRTLERVLDAGEAAAQAAHTLTMAAQRLTTELGIDEIRKSIRKALELETAVDRSSDAVARGNLKVFGEIGREFARFHGDCLADAVFDARNIVRFCEQLRPGDPPDGQQYLRQAFLHYYQALFEAEPKARIELLLLGNLQIGFHEQTRLQPEINEALAAPLIAVQAFAHNLRNVLNLRRSRLGEAVWFIKRLFRRLTDFNAAIAEYRAVAQREAQLIITETMMTIEIPPHQRLRLGDDLTASFPPLLQQIANPDLRLLLEQIDPTPDSPRESGAEHWGDLPDRLHFIADMFRCYQTSGELLTPPFTADQSAAIMEGRLPAGRL